mgnify:CR=1 FL=1
MSKSKLLKEAIADAKALKESALASAKIALEEAFTPKLQSMISAKMMQEMDDEEMESEMELEPEMGAEDEEEEDMELEAVIRELEAEDGMEDESEFEDEMEEDVAVEEYESEEEDIDIQEVIDALREFDQDEDGTPEEGPALEEAHAEIKRLKTELAEALEANGHLQESVTVTNLLNSKLLFSSKLFKKHDLNESQKVKVIENLDRAKTVAEVKLVYVTIAESLSKVSKKSSLRESASNVTPSTKPTTNIIKENNLGDRFAKLAGLDKKVL